MTASKEAAHARHPSEECRRVRADTFEGYVKGTPGLYQPPPAAAR